ncbi:hypothetical protein FUA48_09660 [Flavobacterium alkalisoli]|uniref:DUF6896 domain-containing protein n=1 Tax=Flavobacterium alkalisoli TaxID=2602769 RepID=A0A5B9FUF7_9FLAO|nr:hypothetical protein [Flavobacterium alkalisoli]QEE49841.1 hypothetical protein FUA48_09660 [Flavobacterium alkalisoli]
MKKILDNYYDFIETFEKLLMSEYGLDVNPYSKAGTLVPRKGKIGEFEYHYHGAGCTVKKDDIICEYNIVPVNKPGIKFSLWSFSEYVNSSSALKKSGYTSDYIRNELEKLIDEGILEWDDIDGNPINIYIYNRNI